MQTRSKGNANLQQLPDTVQPRTPVQQHIQRFEEMEDNPRPRLIPQGAPNLVGGGDTANANNLRQGILPPGIENNNFEIKVGLINMVQQNRFHGLQSEDPLDHIDRFDKLLALLKINGVSEDALKLRLFPFSLGDKAHTWETNLPPGSITTWAACKNAFLAKFFSPIRTATLRNNISSFKQCYNESFHDAWERFRALTHQCPHHGFSDATLLSTIYRGALPKFRQLLDTASNGSFLAKDVGEAMLLVENLSQSDAHYGEEYDRRTPTDINDEKRDKEMKALHEKMDKQASLIDKLLTTSKEQNQVVSSMEEFTYEMDGNYIQEGMNEEEMCYMGNQEFKFKAHHPNLNYGYNNIANPQDVAPPQKNFQSSQVGQSPQGQQAKPQGAFQPTNIGATQQRPSQAPPGFQQQRFGNQQRFFQPNQRFFPNHQSFGNQQGQGYGNNAPQGFNQPQQSAYSPTPQQVFTQGPPQQASQSTLPQGDLVNLMHQMLSGQTALNTRIGNMEDEIKHLKSNETSSSRHGQLPGKAEANPKEYINSIELRSGKTLQSREDTTNNEAIVNQKGG